MSWPAYSFGISLFVLATACSDGRETLARMLIPFDTQEYWFTVTESRPTGVDRTLSIACTAGCAPQRAYSEPAQGFPLGIFRLTDSYPLVVVTWGGPTATTIEVFAIEAGHVRKVFERHSRGPLLVSERDGALRIATEEFPPGGSGPNAPLITDTWTWSGGGFVRTE